MMVVLVGVLGVCLEVLLVLLLMLDVLYFCLLFDGVYCECLFGDGWDDYVRLFCLLEDVYVLVVLVGWFYGVGYECGWFLLLLLCLVGIFGGCVEVVWYLVVCVGI